jgi:hypothetical protein
MKNKEIFPFSNYNVNDDFVKKEFRDPLKIKRVEHIFNNYIFKCKKFYDYHSKRFELSNSIKFYVEYSMNGRKESGEIYPQMLYNFGCLLFNDNINIITFKCKLFGELKEKFKNLSDEFFLKIKFSKDHFNNIISNIWKVNNKGYLVGKLDPLRGKFEADHFRNWLQIEQRMILSLIKMKFFIYQGKKRKRKRRNDEEEDLREKKKRKTDIPCEINNFDKIKKEHTLQVEEIRKVNFKNNSDLLMSLARISFKSQENTQKRINGLTKNSNKCISNLPYFDQIINPK